MTRVRARRIPVTLAPLAVLAVLTAVGAGGLLAAGAGTAGAHSDTATMGIEVTPGAAPLTAKVRILLEYTSDGHVAAGATVSAQAAGPDGATVAATPLDDVGGGNYEGILTMPSPGQWTVTVTATGPAGDASATVDLVTPTSGSFSGDLDETPSTDPDDVRTSSDRASRDEESSDDGPSPAFLATIAVVLVAAAAATFVLVRRR